MWIGYLPSITILIRISYHWHHWHECIPICRIDHEWNTCSSGPNLIQVWANRSLCQIVHSNSWVLRSRWVTSEDNTPRFYEHLALATVRYSYCDWSTTWIKGWLSIQSSQPSKNISNKRIRLLFPADKDLRLLQLASSLAVLANFRRTFERHSFFQSYYHPSISRITGNHFRISCLDRLTQSKTKGGSHTRQVKN